MLEIGELADLEPVEDDLPADSPGPEGGRRPVVLLETEVVLGGIHATGREALQIEIVDVLRRRLQDELELVVLVEAVRVLPVATVGGPAGGLHIDDLPGRGAEDPEERLGMHGSCTHLHVVGLDDDGALLRPEAGQLQDQVLESHWAAAPA